MRRLIILAALALIGAGADGKQDYKLPELHVVKSAVLTPSYSCRPQEEFQKGYQETALFLSDYSKRGRRPDLLFNGACRGDNYFEASTGGDDMALIADLGADTPVEKIAAHSVFNMRGVHDFPAYSRFTRVAKVEKNHTYAVLLNKSDIRGLFIFTVVDYVPSERVELRYAVKEYQILNERASSPGFDWAKESYEKKPEAKN